MTTPNTKSYNDARWAAIKKFEIVGKPDKAFYLDDSGFVTIGYGTLVTKNGATQPYAKAVVSNSTDPELAQKLVDAFAGSRGTVAATMTSLENKGFVFEGSRIVGFKDGVDANGKPVVIDISDVLPEAGATKVTESITFPEKEKLVDAIEARFTTPFTEEQRAAVLSRVYNGVPKETTIEALASQGTPEAALAFFSSYRGGKTVDPNANPGHYARTIEEAREFLGDSVKATTVGNATGFTYTDKDGNDVFIGSQSGKIGGKTRAELVAYKVVTNEDQTQTQVPVTVSNLPQYMNVATSSHLPTDPAVAFNNAYLSGDPVKLLSALTLDPAIKSPQAALEALHQYAPELGELQDINLGTDRKPIWAKGYVSTDDDGRTTILAVSKDSKGKAALVGYEIDAPTEADPNPSPHALQVTAPQSKIPALKISDSGEIGDAVASADTNLGSELNDEFSASVLPVTLQQVDIDGQTYTVNENGTLERPVPGNPGWVELRDNTGGGVILDPDGAVMAQLQPGDRVGMMDDGRITINDNNGHSVNRTVDEGQAGAFYQHPSSTPIGDAALDQLVDAFTNIDTSQAGPGVQYADAGNGDVVSDAGGGGSSGSAGTSASNPPLAPAVSAPAAPETIANPGTPLDLQAYMNGPGATLSPAQQYALANQLGHLGLGAVDGNTLSLHSLPGGGALLANADGDIVGEVSISSTGDLRLQATTINTDGSAGTQDLHISTNGASSSHAEVVAAQMQAALEQAQFNAAANDAAGALSLVNSLANLAHFDQLTDLGKAQSLIGLYNQIDNLGSATAQLAGSTGGNLPLDLGQWGAGLGLISALQGNDPIAQASAAGAFYNSFGSASTNIPLPYLQALNLIGAIESGNTVSMIASAVAFIPGWGTALSLAITILAPLLADKPPPPEGVTHYEWDASGNIQIHVDFNQSHGGEMAQRTATSVQGLLNSIVQSINDQTADTSDNVAINPYLLPRVGFSQSGGAWIEMTTPDGGSYREMIQGNNLAQRLFDILTENGGIAPAWQVQTQLGHMQQLLDQGAGQGEIAAQLGAGAGGHAYHGNEAYAIEGNATESADFKTQSFGALVVHLGARVVQSDAVQASTQALQDLQDQQTELAVQTSELYRDTEGDGYYEKTQWVSATDAQGHVQGLLVLDYNGNGQIETRDILNLGGNAGHATEGAAQPGNQANDALAASANAHLQRNNVEWLDANGDNVLDAHDPAFAAIKLWVDLNQDARLDAGEQADLASLQITSINFTTGEVTYADGHSDALSATTLQSDTEGVRYTQMQEADAEGNLHTVNAGQMLEHEGYQGQVQVVDQGGVTRWGTVREATFEQDALTTGDWEGTAEQDQHRHGGTNVASAPTQNRYAFDSCSRIFHEGQRPFLLESANSPVWGIYG